MMGILEYLSRKLQGVDRFNRQKLEIHAEQWINTRPIKTGALKGKVVLIYFSSVKDESEDTVHQLNLWHQMFPDDSLVIISLFSPEKRIEEIEKTKLFINQRGMNYPVAIDDDHKTEEFFKVRFKPTFFLFDKGSRLRYKVLESGDLTRIGAAIMKLSSE